jgi:hypothetical protein
LECTDQDPQKLTGVLINKTTGRAGYLANEDEKADNPHELGTLSDLSVEFARFDEHISQDYCHTASAR